MEAKSDGDLAYEAGEGPGQEPAGRLRAQAALSVRLRRSLDALRAETARSARRLERLTVVLVVLTIVIVAMTAVLIVRG